MQSMASLMSTTNNNDIATLEDFDEDEEKESKQKTNLVNYNKIIKSVVLECFSGRRNCRYNQSVRNAHEQPQRIGHQYSYER